MNQFKIAIEDIEGGWSVVIVEPHSNFKKVLFESPSFNDTNKYFELVLKRINTQYFIRITQGQIQTYCCFQANTFKFNRLIPG